MIETRHRSFLIEKKDAVNSAKKLTFQMLTPSREGAKEGLRCPLCDFA
jgi:hypothetical protein